MIARILSVSCVSLAMMAGCGPKGSTQPPMVADAPAVDEGSTAVDWPDEKFRYERPTAGAIPQVKTPEIQVFQLAKGPQVYLVERHDLPIVSLQMTFDAGKIDDPGNKTGLASLCMDLLDEGTAARDKVAFEEAIADLASNVSTFGGEETSGVVMSSLRRNLVPTVDLMVEMLEQPGLRATDFDRLKEQRRASIVQAKAAPGSLGSRLWDSVVWGKEHPHGRIVTERSIEAVTLADCRKHVGKLGPTGARLFVFGDVTREQIENEVGPKLARWKGAAPRARKVPKAKPRDGVVFFVDVPGAAQSQLFVGHPGPQRQADDYASTDLMARILGGGFSSRINMNIREDKGYAYGARASFSYARHGSAFAASSSVRTDATADALREIAKEIRTMQTGEVRPEELSREREGTLLSLPAQFATGRRIVGAYSELVYYGLGLDWYDKFQDVLASLSGDDVRKAAERHLRPDDVKVLVVGDGEKVLEGVKQLVRDGVFGGKSVVVLDGDGNVVERIAIGEASKGVAAKG